MQATYIAYAASWLAGSGAMSYSNFSAMLKQLMVDPTVDIGSQLAIEELLYDLNAL